MKWIGLLDRVDRHYVRMIECSDSASLPLEAGQPVGVAGHVEGQDLEGYIAPELCVGCAVHLSHAACANYGADPVVGYRAPEQAGLRSVVQLSALRA